METEPGPDFKTKLEAHKHALFSKLVLTIVHLPSPGTKGEGKENDCLLGVLASQLPGSSKGKYCHLPSRHVSDKTDGKSDRGSSASNTFVPVQPAEIYFLPDGTVDISTASAVTIKK
jgi:hypothetical protein